MAKGKIYTSSKRTSTGTISSPSRRRTTGISLPFSETRTEEWPKGRKNVISQKGFNVSVRSPRTSGNGTKYIETLSKPGYVTEKRKTYEDSGTHAPVLRRGTGAVALKRGGVVGPKNVSYSTSASENYVRAGIKSVGIKRQTVLKKAAAAAGKNTTGKRVAL